MIQLYVKDYCHICPDFEADVDKEEHALHVTDPLSYAVEDIVRTNTVIRCAHRKKCECIYRRALKEIENKNKDGDKNGRK